MTTAAYAEKLKQENARLRMWLRAVLKFAPNIKIKDDIVRELDKE